MEKPVYFLIRDGQQSGPFTLESITQVALTSSLDPSVQYWSEGMTEWKPLSELIKAALPPLHPDVEKLFPASLYTGERHNGWISFRKAFPEHFSHLDRVASAIDPVEYFYVSGGKLTENIKLLAVTKNKVHFIFRNDSASYVVMGGTKVVPDFEGKIVESYERSEITDCHIQWNTLTRQLFISHGGKSRWIFIDCWEADKLSAFEAYLKRVGLTDSGKTAEREAKKQSGGCMILIATGAATAGYAIWSQIA